MKTLTIALILTFFSLSGLTQTPTQQKEIDKVLRMQDSIMNTHEFKAIMKKSEEINEYNEELQKKSNQNKKHSENYTKISQTNKVPAKDAILSSNIAYSETSYSESKDPGNNMGILKSVLKIYHAPNMIRFENPEKKYEPINIFRYDKNIIWHIHPERPQYKGVKLYQEFKLQNGRGINSHIDAIITATNGLKNPDKLKDMGQEMMDEQVCTRYRNERTLSWETEPNNKIITDYWINKDKILIKMSYTGPDVSGTLETKNIRLSSQTETLFVPPSNFKKAGNIITWKEEKEKLDARKISIEKNNY